MKIIIAAACVCIIAATGYFFVSQYIARRDAQQQAEFDRVVKDRQDCVALRDKSSKWTEVERALLLDCNRRGILKYQ